MSIWHFQWWFEVVFSHFSPFFRQCHLPTELSQHWRSIQCWFCVRHWGLSSSQWSDTRIWFPWRPFWSFWHCRRTSHWVFLDGQQKLERPTEILLCLGCVLAPGALLCCESTWTEHNTLCGLGGVGSFRIDTNGLHTLVQKGPLIHFWMHQCRQTWEMAVVPFVVPDLLVSNSASLCTVLQPFSPVSALDKVWTFV